jgi:hypothetical protein
MGETVVVADEDGTYYALPAACRFEDVTPGELAAARVPAESRAAVDTALTYERAGAFGADGPPVEVRVCGRVMHVVGNLGAGGLLL